MSSSPPFSMNAQQQQQSMGTVSVNNSMERDFKKPFQQCFWQANGTLSCQNPTVLPDSSNPDSISHFNTFTEPNANYAPNAYHAQSTWYNKNNEPCCNLPCTVNCAGQPFGFMQNTMSPPRGPPTFQQQQQ